MESKLRSGCEELGIVLSVDQQRRLLRYLELVLAENEHINVTAIRDIETALTFHLLDSLTVVRWWQDMGHEKPPATLLDLGTGGGFPAAPLAIAWPKTKVTAIDGTGKKIGVVERCAKAAGISNLVARHIRGGDVARDSKTRPFELITARAVGYSAKLLREVHPLCAPGGWICLMKGPMPPEEELRAAERFCEPKPFVMQKPYLTSLTGLEQRTILGFRRDS